MISLRDYQDDLTTAIRKSYASGKRAPMVVLPTGGGKTTIFAYVTTGAAKKGRCVFLLAHRAELIKQISMTLARFGTKHNIIAPAAIIRQAKIEQFKAFGRSMIDASTSVYVASAQTLVRKLDDLPDVPDLIVIDEAHHLIEGSTWGKIVAACPGARLLPVTATPIRMDGKGLGVNAGGFADDIVLGPKMRWLIDNGYLSEYRVFAPPNLLDLTGIKTRMGDYAKDQLSEAMDKPGITGDAVEHYLKLASGKRAVVFCVSVEHARHVAENFRAAGVVSEFLDGSLDPGERDATIKRFESGDTKVLTSCDIVSEGFDLPAIEVAILLRPTKSTSLYLQQVGRALRTFPGKQEAIILDHVGAVITHGLPDEDREWSLDGITKKKRAASDTPDVNIKTCPSCFIVHLSAPMCPACGMVYPVRERKVEQADGELIELTAAGRAVLKQKAEQEKAKARRARFSAEHKCQTIEELVQLGVERGYQYPAQWAERRWEYMRKGREAG